jgi:hypothetical protein
MIGRIMQMLRTPTAQVAACVAVVSYAATRLITLAQDAAQTVDAMEHREMALEQRYGMRLSGYERLKADYADLRKALDLARDARLDNDVPSTETVERVAEGLAKL